MPKIAGFRLETCWGDLMHDLYLGVGGVAISSGLVELMEHRCICMPDGSAFASDTALLSALREDLKQWCKRTDRRNPSGMFTHASLGRAHKTDYPELSWRFKAAHVNTMLPWMAELTAAVVDMSSERSRTRACLFWALAQFVEILDHAGRFLSDSEFTQVQRVWGICFCLHL